MKKFLVIFLALSFLPAFADVKNLSFGETLTLYFTEIFPSGGGQIDNVIVKYSDITNSQNLRSALQRGIYYGMMPNTDTRLKPETVMTDRSFAQLLQSHFGIEATGDTSALTNADYNRYMMHIRDSYAYKLLQSINQNTMDEIVATPAATPAISDADKYHVLDEVYATIRQGYLHADDAKDSDLLYAATE